jgi:hypothetical protein
MLNNNYNGEPMEDSIETRVATEPKAFKAAPGRRKKTETVASKNTIYIPEVSKTDPNSPAERLRRLREEETKTVRGRFRNFESPGGSLRVQVKKYKEVPMYDQLMQDNMEYEVPLYIARHLNGIDHIARELNGKLNTCAYPVHGHIMQGDNWAPSPLDGNGIPVVNTQVSKWIRRYGFESLQFESLGL